MNQKQISQSICDVYNALDTLTIKGYIDCKTYTNCMETLRSLVTEVMNLQVLEEANKQGSD